MPLLEEIKNVLTFAAFRPDPDDANIPWSKRFVEVAQPAAQRQPHPDLVARASTSADAIRRRAPRTATSPRWPGSTPRSGAA